MEFNLTTFFFEIINFALLVWLLTWLCYRPILAAIAQRQAQLEKIRAEAEQQSAEAAKLQELYAARMADWEKEKAELRCAQENALAAERVTRLETLRVELDGERKRAEVTAAAHLREVRQLAEQQLAGQGAHFCTRLLERFASAALEESMIQAALTDLAELPAERRQALVQALTAESSVRVKTRFPLSSTMRENVRTSLGRLAGRELTPSFTEESALLAGLRIELGSWSLEASLGDELRAFAAVAEG